MIPTDNQAVENETSKDKFTRYLKSIFDTVKMTYVLVVENNELLKKSTSANSGTVTYEGMLQYISKRPMYNLTPRQIYWCVEQKYPIEYIQAISGYKPEEIKKKYEQHKKNNVY